MTRAEAGLDAARAATVKVCNRTGTIHYGQGLLLLVDTDPVVLTCHHVIALADPGELSIAVPQPGSRLSDPIGVTYDHLRSRPGQDAVVLGVEGVSLAKRPLLHELDPSTYSGRLAATGITYLEPATFDASITAATPLNLAVKRTGAWPDPPQRYEINSVFRLSDPTDARPGISGGVVVCEGGVLGLVHFARAAGATHQREGYVVPLAVWAEHWPSLAALIEPLIDHYLRSAATVRRARNLRVGTDILIGQARDDIYIEREIDEKARAAVEQANDVIIVGRPKSGKTRLAWQLFKEQANSYVVLPHQNLPPGSFEVAGLSSRSLYLFADDLSRTSLESDLLEWQRRLQEATGQACPIICTVRDGNDLKTVEGQPRLARLLSRDGMVYVYASRADSKGADFPEDAGRRLATALELRYGEFERRFDGTPGSLSLNLEEMAKRYDRLRDESAGGVSMTRLLDVAKLVNTSGQPRLNLSLLREVAERVRGDGSPISPEIWEKMVRRTTEEGFGYPNEHGDLQVYRSYLESCVAYQPSVPELEALLPILEGREDWEGLYQLARALYTGPTTAGTWSTPSGSPLAERAARTAVAHGYDAATDVLGWILSKEEKTKPEAERLIRKDIADGHINQYISLGDLLATQPGREAEAESAFRAAIEGGEYLANLGLGNLLAGQSGREADAEAAYKKLLEEEFLLAYAPLAQLVAGQPGRASEAEEIYRQGIAAIANTQYEALVGGDMSKGLGWLLASQEGREREAEDALKRAIAAGDSRAYVDLGHLLESQPDRESETEEAYRNAVSAGDKAANAYLGQFLAAQEGRQRDAEAAYRQAIDGGVLVDAAWNNLGLLLVRQLGREAEAEHAFRRAAEAGAENGTSNLCVLLSSQLGREADAERACRAAVAVGATRRRTELVEVLMRAERWQEAEAECRVAVSEGNQQVFYALGFLLAGQEGREREAEDALKRAIAAGDSRAYADLGALLESQPGRESEAEEAYRNAVSAGDQEANGPLESLLRRRGRRRRRR